MSKRNFILLIIILSLITIGVFVFLYLQKSEKGTGNNTVGTNFTFDLNPFGTTTKPPATTPPADVSDYQPNPTAPETPKMRLTRISSMAVAGFTVFSKERLKDIPIVVANPSQTLPLSGEGVPPAKGGTGGLTKPTPPPTEFMPALRYVEQTTGNIYQTFADKIEERKFSTTVIPKVYDAYFGNKGGSVVMRYLKADGDTIETFVGALPKELVGGDTSGENEIKGSFLPDNVKDISISPDNSKIFYLFISGNNMIGTILNLPTNKKIQIFDSPFTEWLSQWPNSNIVTLSTKPSAQIPGYMYTMDSAGKNLHNVLGNINGLTTRESPNGKLILVGDNNLALNAYHADTRSSDPLGIKTLPEKCVWGKVSDVVYCAVPKGITPGEYPDIWYQGSVSFNDQIWKVDIKTGNATLLIDPVTINGGGVIDGIKLALDEGENYLFFVNKKDNFLWKLDLK